MKKNGKRIFSLILIILMVPTILSGCFNYNEINQITFVTSAIFDIDDTGNVILYLDSMRPYRNTSESSDNGKRVIYKGVGKTALEAIRDVNMASSYKINFTQNRALIFTEAAAKQGINKFLNLINNDQEFQVKPYAFVYFGDVKNLIDISQNDEEYIGLFLNDLVDKNKKNPRSIISNINDYIVDSEIGNNYAVMSGLEIRKDVVDQRVELSGGVLMRDNKMIEKIDVTDGMSYNFLMDKIKTGTLEIANPQMNEGFVTLEILNSKTKTNVEYKDDKVTLNKKIKVKAVIAEAQGRFVVSKEALDTLKAKAEQNIKDYLEQFFYGFIDKDIDILQVERLLEIKYPQKVIEDVLSKIDFNLDVEINIQGGDRVESSLV
ncbi:Ger(x)C family spore germination protein [Clostridium sardiniense]|uniref:Ger(X)C family spore germination protein n=1 Tax=Clostridium sardiniense TaxID=29369 RepID=A0ABS7KTM4_CLOSR|nr:Ger(x)C family spore germination protein [Clostridium sardiniense]MBY0753967.1 Ger(x)C family spore germination protein [Clostridium sardiniense]MDQ0459517.1 Ger(x)C family germination protein [Clostridium sardiniense]